MQTIGEEFNLLRRRSITQKQFQFQKEKKGGWVGSPVSSIKQNFILGLKKKDKKYTNIS